MNIKQHIEAGHYPTDDKGRALIPTADGRTFVVAATDRPYCFPLFGWYTNDGAQTNSYACEWSKGSEGQRLLPPPPRKVKVTRYAVMITASDNRCHATFAQRGMAEQEAAQMRNTAVVVELTGEYEEPWS